MAKIDCFKLLATIQMIPMLVVIMEQIHSSCDQDDIFTNNSEKHLKVSRSQRRGRRNKADIVWDAFQMLNDPSCHNIQSAKLEIKTNNDNQWISSEENIINAGRKYKWSVDVKPCFKYSFRVKLPSNEVAKEVPTTYNLTPETILEPLTREELLASDYTPDPPTSVHVNVSNYKALLTWASTNCVTNYEVIYFESGDEDNVKIKKVENETSSALSDLKPCTNYKAIIYSIFNENYAETITDFTTLPMNDVASNLKIDLKVTSNEIQISWPTWENVSCIEQYRIGVRLANSSCLIQDEMIQREVCSPTIYHQIKGLASNETYTISIQPLFEEMKLDVMEKVVQTEFSSDKFHTTNVQNKCINEKSHMKIRKEDALIRKELINNQRKNTTSENADGLKLRAIFDIKLYFVIILLLHLPIEFQVTY